MKKKNSKIALLITLILLFISFAIYYILIPSRINLINTKTNLLGSHATDNAKLEWADLIISHNYLFHTDNTKEDQFANAVFAYSNRFQKINKFSSNKLSPISISQIEMSEEDLSINREDENFPKNKIYSLTNINEEYNEKHSFIVTINNSNTFTHTYKIKRERFFNEISINGIAEDEEFKKLLDKNLATIKEEIKNKNTENLQNYLINEDIEKLLKIDSVEKRSSNLIFKNFSYNDFVESPDNTLQIGKVDVYYNNTKYGESKVYYDFIKHQYKFSDISSIINKVSLNKITYQPPTNVTILKCTDCFLAPVDKNHQLRSDYYPKVVSTNLPGGGQVTKETLPHLQRLFADAQKQGIKPKITSSFRSYNTQISTFNYWVNSVLRSVPNISRAEAERRANVFSARPGQSEHQLGTTVDLQDERTVAFGNNSYNSALYKFLEENAHKYGFAISYPKNTTQYTGYKYEPWHVRYIGVELATELYNLGYLNQNGMYLAKFLKDKNLAN